MYLFCSQENTIYTKDNSTCSCTVSDPDGWLDQMTFEIVNNTNVSIQKHLRLTCLFDGSILQDEAYIFALEYRVEPEDTVYSADVYVTVGTELNYQNITFYLFDIRAKVSNICLAVAQL